MFNYEYRYFDGEYFHTLNILAINKDRMAATISITCAGKISMKDFDLRENENGLYEYGPLLDIIQIEDFEIAE